MKHRIISLKYFLLLPLFFLLCGHKNLKAQDFEKEFKAFKEAQKREHDGFKDSITHVFSEFVKANDEAFYKHLMQSWQEFEQHKGQKSERKPSPAVIPEYKPTEDTKEVMPDKMPVIKPYPIDEPFVSMSLPDAKTLSENLRPLSFNFYGSNCNIKYDMAILEAIKLNNTNNTSVAQAWQQLANTPHAYLIEQLLQYKTTFNLNDWAYYMFINKMSASFTSNRNEVTLLTWFLLTKSGYDTRIGYTDNNLYLLLPSLQTIYDTPYYIINGIHYYCASAKPKNHLNIYTENYRSHTNKLFDMHIYSPLWIASNTKNKTLNFSYKGKSHKISVSYNMNLKDFYNNYPLCDMSIYMNAPLSPEIEKSLWHSFEPLLKGMTPVEQVAFYLNFVQTAFSYMDDLSFHGREKYYFPCEVFFYDYSDCEDRSALLSAIIRHFTELDVIGLEYHDHMATAIALGHDINGDYVMYNNKKYTVCDPTFIGAPIGATMTGYEYEKVSIVPTVSSFILADNVRSQIRNTISQGGGFLANTSVEFIEDNNGDFYFNGFFNASFKYGNFSFSGNAGTYYSFLLKTNAKGDLVWCKILSDYEHLMPMIIRSDNDNNIYLSGYFSNSLKIDNKTMKTARTDVFVVKINDKGTTEWATALGIDKLTGDETLEQYAAKIDKNGTLLWSVASANANLNNVFSLSIDTDKNLLISGLFNSALTALDITSLSHQATFDILAYLIKEKQKLLASETPTHMAGIYVLINYLNINKAAIKSLELKSLLEKDTPGFKNEFPALYYAINHIELIKNENGLITINTLNKLPISIGDITISNKATILVKHFSDGSIKIDILNGMNLRKTARTHDLKSITLKDEGKSIIYAYQSMAMQPTLFLKPVLID